jgi:hypothetical protein
MGEPILVFNLAISENGAFGQAQFNIDFEWLWGFLLRMGIRRYIFGSFKIEATMNQMKNLHDAIGGAVVINPSSKGELEVWDDDLERITCNPGLLEAALKCKSDTEATTQFFHEFEELFEFTAKTGAVKVNQKSLPRVEIFMVRFGQLMKNVTGMFNYVPRFNMLNVSNSMEMMKCFVTAFPAYINLCKNNGRPWHKRWDYRIIIDESV